ncbi:hypothetical protein JZM24_01600 [Candidatus Sodalis endolongispinus]|uniref:Lipoprotein n=1 Tax=Candidatus Sodalis endolongispinus TaxID=2812662 RepID=A0ABS5Y863_9GAMM|nr:hypothetical protein [Candidatus Sodalis endolongispinus]MBT9431179.1 hypothetical protein [Candidatus Sodalis endolongispinus]
MNGSLPQRGRKRRLEVAIALAAALALSGCARGQADDNPARAWLVSVADPGCTGGSAVTNRQTPPILYRALASCIRAQHYQDGVLLFALAGSYSWYDALRVDSDEAREAHSMLLAETMQSVDKRRRQAFWMVVKATLADKQGRQAICQRIQAIGKPTYLPDYLSSFAAAGVLTRPMDDEAMWKAATAGYVHCPTDMLVIH